MCTRPGMSGVLPLSLRGPEFFMRMHAARFAALLALPLIAGSAPALAQPASDNILREGEGPRRARLDKTERKPFDASSWSKLSEWKNGAAPTGATMAGHPVLLLFWTDYIPASKRALALARKLSDQYASQGLIVVCAHGAQDWENAAKPAPGKDATLLIAHDAKGELRKQLESDADPDFYVIDRAGQMRFADIATESVEGAVEIVVKESQGDAASLNDRLAAEARKREEDARKTEALRENIDLTKLPEVPFAEPDEEAYKAVKWPAVPRDENSYSDPAERDKPAPPQPVSIPDSNWFPSRPELKGRVVLMYFWHPDARVSWMRDLVNLDILQRQHSRDMVVVGVLSPLADANSQGGEKLKIETDPEKLKKSIDDFFAGTSGTHYVLADAPGNFLAMTDKGYQNYNGGKPVPWIAIISSDSKMRWWGWAKDPKGRAALDKILDSDPGVIARKKAEDAYIRAKGTEQK